ncbi:chalcone isomerase family protein [Pseudomonas sp. EL_65y_Pfl2_R95]|uniref:chalcone isomerase family protein n=1 Tax=Pseudomonas sp. EL_65y_Pfl2_R95 TaxID=3088698 RepID=UPI0030DB404F
MSRSTLVHLWLICCLIVVPLSATAGWRTVLPDTELVGQGDLRIWGLRIYTARLWSAQQPFDSTKPFALELIYHRDISREQFVDASLDEIRRTSGNQVSPAQLVEWRGEMQRAFVDIKEGQRITGVNLAEGCQFYVDGRLHHEVRDSAFVKAFFGIWFDPKTRDSALREQLLGRR